MAGWLWGNSEEQQARQASPSQTPVIPVSRDPNPAVTHSKLVPISSKLNQVSPSDRRIAAPSATSSVDSHDRDERAALEELAAAIRDPSSHSPASISAEAQAVPQDEYDHSIYPSTLSCTQCFDAAFFCSSVGGQLANVYRYGGMRSCSDLWAQWRFCMRTKGMGEEERRRRIREWWREKEARKRIGRCSEEVWTLRSDEEGAEGAFKEGRPVLEEDEAENQESRGMLRFARGLLPPKEYAEAKTTRTTDDAGAEKKSWWNWS